MQDERVVRCFEAECQEPATYKIAAPMERRAASGKLKTYGFACAAHLKDVLRKRPRRDGSPTSPCAGEIVQDICILTATKPGKARPRADAGQGDRGEHPDLVDLNPRGAGKRTVGWQGARPRGSQPRGPSLLVVPAHGRATRDGEQDRAALWAGGLKSTL